MKYNVHFNCSSSFSSSFSFGRHVDSRDPALSYAVVTNLVTVFYWDQRITKNNMHNINNTFKPYLKLCF